MDSPGGKIAITRLARPEAAFLAHKPCAVHLPVRLTAARRRARLRRNTCYSIPSHPRSGPPVARRSFRSGLPQSLSSGF
jgi:hypothetical protein